MGLLRSVHCRTSLSGCYSFQVLRVNTAEVNQLGSVLLPLPVSTTQSSCIVNVRPRVGDSHGLDRPWKVEYGACCGHGGEGGVDLSMLPVSMSRVGQLSSVFTSQLCNALWVGVAASRGSSSAPLTLLVLTPLGLASAEAKVSCNLSLPINLKMSSTCLEPPTGTLSRHISLSFECFCCSLCVALLF